MRELIAKLKSLSFSLLLFAAVTAAAPLGLLLFPSDLPALAALLVADAVVYWRMTKSRRGVASVWRRRIWPLAAVALFTTLVLLVLDGIKDEYGPLFGFGMSIFAITVSTFKPWLSIRRRLAAGFMLFLALFIVKWGLLFIPDYLTDLYPHLILGAIFIDQPRQPVERSRWLVWPAWAFVFIAATIPWGMSSSIKQHAERYSEKAKISFEYLEWTLNCIKEQEIKYGRIHKINKYSASPPGDWLKNLFPEPCLICDSKEKSKFEDFIGLRFIDNIDVHNAFSAWRKKLLLQVREVDILDSGLFERRLHSDRWGHFSYRGGYEGSYATIPDLFKMKIRGGFPQILDFIRENAVAPGGLVLFSARIRRTDPVYFFADLAWSNILPPYVKEKPLPPPPNFRDKTDLSGRDPSGVIIPLKKWAECNQELKMHPDARMNHQRIYHRELLETWAREEYWLLRKNRLRSVPAIEVMTGGIHSALGYGEIPEGLVPRELADLQSVDLWIPTRADLVFSGADEAEYSWSFPVSSDNILSALDPDEQPGPTAMQIYLREHGGNVAFTIHVSNSPPPASFDPFSPRDPEWDIRQIISR